MNARLLQDHELRCLATLNAELQIIRNIRREPLTDENLLLTLAAGARAQQALDELHSWREAASVLAAAMRTDRHA